MPALLSLHWYSVVKAGSGCGQSRRLDGASSLSYTTVLESSHHNYEFSPLLTFIQSYLTRREDLVRTMSYWAAVAIGMRSFIQSPNQPFTYAISQTEDISPSLILRDISWRVQGIQAAVITSCVAPLCFCMGAPRHSRGGYGRWQKLILLLVVDDRNLTHTHHCCHRRRSQGRAEEA
ncbi:hypothetical protein BC834DRAFT_477197 [Gloeopeniophorella convolvens]|nr:hypothetical protein BC834DRAFT_477197 [Gloeopeniophorella convolvens]